LKFVHASFPREAVESERTALGFTQAETGAALMRLWEFPETMTDPVRWQYSPRASVGETAMASLLYAAKWLRSSVCYGGGMPAPEVANLQPLGLGVAALQAMVPELRRKLAEVSSQLDAVALDDEENSPADAQRFPGRAWEKVA
jgi:hypothetical protein